MPALHKHHYKAEKSFGVEPARGRGRGVKSIGTQTVYIKLPLDIVNFVYEKYPDLTLAGGVEKFLSNAASAYASGVLEARSAC